MAGAYHFAELVALDHQVVGRHGSVVTVSVDEHDATRT